MRIAGILMLATGLWAGAAHAQTPEDFYKGRTVRMLVGFGAGTGNDLYMRALAQNIGRFLPGHPTIVPENMPGAASLGMMNYLYNAAPKDGTVVGLPSYNLLTEPMFGNQQAKFDAKKFNWFGSMSRDTALCFTWAESGVKTLDDAKKREVLVGSTGQASNSYFFPRLLNALFDTKFKPVVGYPDSGAIGIAMERGELQGYCSFPLAAIRSARPQWITDKKIDILLQMTLHPHPDLPGVPVVTDLTRDETVQKALKLVFESQDMARPFAGPPGMPADRSQMWRTAFDAVMKDPAFLADAKKMGVDIDGPIDGAAVDRIVDDIYATPADVVARVKALRDAS